MRIGTLVNHEDYFGVGIVTDITKVNGKTQWLIYWLREGRTVGWAWADVDLGKSVKIICK